VSVAGKSTSTKNSWNTRTAPTPPPSFPARVWASVATRQSVMLSARSTVTVALPSGPVISWGLS
jgi:hypothetical protein